MSTGTLENCSTGNKFNHMFIKNKNLNFVYSYMWNGGYCRPITCFSVNYICYCFIYVIPQAEYWTSLILIWMLVDIALNIIFAFVKHKQSIILSELLCLWFS